LVTDLNVYPLDDDQAATKKYVDTLRDQVVSGLADLVDNGTF
jgi:hypothetical protein